jgi:hypothetical protein
MKYIQLSITLFDHELCWRWSSRSGFRYEHIRLGMGLVFEVSLYVHRT